MVLQMSWRRRWTEAEDEILRTEVNKATEEGRPLLWRELAKVVPGRTNKDCRRRWWNSLAGTAVRGPWTESEDERLATAVRTHGPKWSRVALDVGTRNSDQCSSHWSQALNPSINYSDWTSDEDTRLLQEVRRLGTNWIAVATTHVPKRTTLALKNRWTALSSRRNAVAAQSLQTPEIRTDGRGGRGRLDCTNDDDDDVEDYEDGYGDEDDSDIDDDHTDGFVDMMLYPQSHGTFGPRESTRASTHNTVATEPSLTNTYQDSSQFLLSHGGPVHSPSSSAERPLTTSFPFDLSSSAGVQGTKDAAGFADGLESSKDLGSMSGATTPWCGFPNALDGASMATMPYDHGSLPGIPPLDNSFDFAYANDQPNRASLPPNSRQRGGMSRSPHGENRQVARDMVSSYHQVNEDRELTKPGSCHGSRPMSNGLSGHQSVTASVGDEKELHRVSIEVLCTTEQLGNVMSRVMGIAKSAKVAVDKYNPD